MAAYLYEVINPILHPVAARAGDVLAVRPGHATRPLLVFRFVDGRWMAVTAGPPNYGALLVREDEGFIRQIFASVSLPLSAHPQTQTA